MRTVYRLMFCIAAVAVIAFAPPAAGAREQGISAEKGSVDQLPVITLKDWKDSTAPEQRAFLAGLVNMLQMEYAWQGKNELPIGQSTVSTWMRGLSGVTIPQMKLALDEYISKRPEKLDRSVLEALGRIYVKPRLSKEERAISEKRVEELKAASSK